MLKTEFSKMDRVGFTPMGLQINPPFHKHIIHGLD